MARCGRKRPHHFIQEHLTNTRPNKFKSLKAVSVSARTSAWSGVPSSPTNLSRRPGNESFSSFLLDGCLFGLGPPDHVQHFGELEPRLRDPLQLFDRNWGTQFQRVRHHWLFGGLRTGSSALGGFTARRRGRQRRRRSVSFHAVFDELSGGDLSCQPWGCSKKILQLVVLPGVLLRRVVEEQDEVISHLCSEIFVPKLDVH